MRSLSRLENGKISYLSAGEGEPFLLLHGIPGSAFAWEKVGQHLAERYQVIIPDLPGFGQSEKLQDDYYMEGQARALNKFLDTIGIKHLYLGGHDFGGPVAITLMRLFPELQINGLVLSATNMFTDTPVPPPLKVASVPVLGDMTFKVMVGNRLGLRMIYLAATRQKDAVTWDEFKRHLTPSGIALTRQIFQRSLADLKTNYQPIEELLPQIEVPTLVLWGDSDPFFPTPVAKRTAQAIGGAALKIYPHTGHFVPEEQPNSVAQDIVDFLASGTHSGRL